MVNPNFTDVFSDTGMKYEGPDGHSTFNSDHFAFEDFMEEEGLGFGMGVLPLASPEHLVEPAEPEQTEQPVHTPAASTSGKTVKATPPAPAPTSRRIRKSGQNKSRGATRPANFVNLVWDSDHKMRYVVHALFEDKTLSNDQREQLFNHIFDKEVQQSSWESGYPFSGMRSMNSEKGLTKRAVQQYWYDIMAPAANKGEMEKRSRLHGRIFRAKRELDI